MTLITWSWLFLVFYMGAMLAIGYIGGRRVKHADDFAYRTGRVRSAVAGVRLRGDNGQRRDLPRRPGTCLRVRDADDLGQFPVSPSVFISAC